MMPVRWPWPRRARNPLAAVPRVRTMRLFSLPSVFILLGVLVVVYVLVWFAVRQTETQDQLGTAVAVGDVNAKAAQAAGVPTASLPSEVRSAAPTTDAAAVPTSLPTSLPTSTVTVEGVAPAPVLITTTVAGVVTTLTVTPPAAVVTVTESVAGAPGPTPAAQTVTMPAPPAVTVTEPAPPPVTVTETVTPPPVEVPGPTVTVTQTAAPSDTSSPATTTDNPPEESAP